jgi:hypothetical protein
MKKLYGFFSQRAKESREKRNRWSRDEDLNRPSFYRTPDGRVVEVTYVQPDNPELDRNFYRWSDTVAVGEVTEPVMK